MFTSLTSFPYILVPLTEDARRYARREESRKLGNTFLDGLRLSEPAPCGGTPGHRKS